MNKIKLFASAALLTFCVVGCASGTKQIGQVGGVTFYRVRSSNFTGPNFTALVTKTDDTVKIEQTFGGPGIGAATISAIGHVGAAAVLGTSFPSNVGDQVTVSGGNSSAAGGTATSRDSMSIHNQNFNQNGATSNSSSTAGASSSSHSGSSANAQGGNGGAGGAGGNGGNGGAGGFTPPGLINNPGHGGTHGNPHQP